MIILQIILWIYIASLLLSLIFYYLHIKTEIGQALLKPRSIYNELASKSLERSKSEVEKEFLRRKFYQESTYRKFLMLFVFSWIVASPYIAIKLTRLYFI